MKTLVVYYTRTGNAKFVAETVAAEIGADLEEVVDMKKREGAFGWLSAGRDAMGQKETEIAPTKRSPADYDLVVIGQPVWAGNPTPAIRTYLKRNDLSGKKVALFFTDRSDQVVEKTKALIPNSTFVGDLTILAREFGNKEDVKKKIAEWCNTLKTA